VYINKIWSIQIQGLPILTTSAYLLAARVYVSYRSQHPDQDIQEKVRKELKENNIDASQLVEYKTDHCQDAEQSTERGSPPKTLTE